MPYAALETFNHATSANGADLLANAREFIKGKLYLLACNEIPPRFQHIHFFSIDSILVYINFYLDFGPSNLAQTVRFCEILQEKFQNPATANKKICLYSSMEVDKRCNAAYLMCAYMVRDLM